MYGACALQDAAQGRHRRLEREDMPEGNRGDFSAAFERVKKTSETQQSRTSGLQAESTRGSLHVEEKLMLWAVTPETSCCDLSDPKTWITISRSCKGLKGKERRRGERCHLANRGWHKPEVGLSTALSVITDLRNIWQGQNRKLAFA